MTLAAQSRALALSPRITCASWANFTAGTSRGATRSQFSKCNVPWAVDDKIGVSRVLAWGAIRGRWRGGGGGGWVEGSFSRGSLHRWNLAAFGFIFVIKFKGDCSEFTAMCKVLCRPHFES